MDNPKKVSVESYGNDYVISVFENSTRPDNLRYFSVIQHKESGMEIDVCDDGYPSEYHALEAAKSVAINLP